MSNFCCLPRLLVPPTPRKLHPPPTLCFTAMRWAIWWYYSINISESSFPLGLRPGTCTVLHKLPPNLYHTRIAGRKWPTGKLPKGCYASLCPCLGRLRGSDYRRNVLEKHSAVTSLITLDSNSNYACIRTRITSRKSCHHFVDNGTRNCNNAVDQTRLKCLKNQAPLIAFLLLKTNV